MSVLLPGRSPVNLRAARVGPGVTGRYRDRLMPAAARTIPAIGRM
jgi:hypothetical protein